MSAEVGSSVADPGRSSGPKIVVARSGPLSGTVMVPGAKNSVLKLMAATLLADGEYELGNVPRILDVEIMAELLRSLGLRIEMLPEDPRPGFGVNGQRLRVINDGAITPVATFEFTDRIRASVNVLGPLLTRFGRIEIALPGGDDFGGRPVDMHLSALEAMGASFTVTSAGIVGSATRLHGAEISLDFPSVGATENVLMAAVLARGTTVISNAAREPEIGDLCSMLVRMGARIEGAGTSTIVVEGVDPGRLGATSHEVVSDRVQAATYMAAVGVCGGEVEVLRAVPEQMTMLLSHFSDMGIVTENIPGGIRVACERRLRSVNIATLPYPGVATDYKPLLVAMLALADGTGIVTENLYPGRFRYVEELRKFGADITVDGHHAVVRGRERLAGAIVTAPDIRAGAALVVTGLAATGITEIGEIHHIDRGYDDLVGRLAGLGGSISRID